MSNSVSNLQKDKFLHIFELLDVDGNGVLQYEDFRLVVDTMCDERGWSKGHRRRLGLTRANKRLWDLMIRYLDADGDGDVSLIEWLNFHFTAFSQDPKLSSANADLNGALNSTAQFFCEININGGDAADAFNIDTVKINRPSGMLVVAILARSSAAASASVSIE